MRLADRARHGGALLDVWESTGELWIEGDRALAARFTRIFVLPAKL